MPLIIALPASVMIMLSAVLLIICLLTALDELDDWLKRHKKVKELCKEYDIWYGRYLSCDNFAGAIDKGKAAAMCVVLRNEIDVLGGDIKKKKKRFPKEAKKKIIKTFFTLIISGFGGKVNEYKRIFFLRQNKRQISAGDCI